MTRPRYSAPPPEARLLGPPEGSGSGLRRPDAATSIEGGFLPGDGGFQTAPLSADAVAAKAAPPKGVGRPKGSRNRSTILIKEAIIAVYADLQEETGGEHAHFREWAKAHPTEFYKMWLRLLPFQVDARAEVRTLDHIVFRGING